MLLQDIVVWAPYTQPESQGNKQDLAQMQKSLLADSNTGTLNIKIMWLSTNIKISSLSSLRADEQKFQKFTLIYICRSNVFT